MRTATWGGLASKVDGDVLDVGPQGFDDDKIIDGSMLSLFRSVGGVVKRHYASVGVLQHLPDLFLQHGGWGLEVSSNQPRGAVGLGPRCGRGYDLPCPCGQHLGVPQIC